MDKQGMVVPGSPVRVTRNGRRYFSNEHRDAVVAKCLAPGASLAAVALANGFNANLVRKWMGQRQASNESVNATAKLVPVTIAQEPARLLPEGLVSRRAAVPVSAAGSGLMQLHIGATKLELHGTVDCEQLSLVLEALLRTR